MIMTAELILVLEVIERLLGGTGDDGLRARADRHRAGPGAAPVRRVRGVPVEHLVRRLRRDPRARRHRYARRGIADRAAAPSRRSSITLEARMARRSTTLALLVPWVTVPPVAAAFASPDEAAGLADDPRSAAAVRDGLRRSRSTCVPRSATRSCPGGGPRAASRRRRQARRQADDDVAVYADAMPVHRARAGRSGTRRAVQILGPSRGGGAMSADASARDLNASASPPRKRWSAPCRTSPPAPRASAPSSPGGGAEQAAEQAVELPAVPRRRRLLRRRRHRRQRLRVAGRGGAPAGRGMMGGEAPEAASGGELTELELSAVGEAMNQMMSAAALASRACSARRSRSARRRSASSTTEAEAAGMLLASTAPPRGHDALHRPAPRRGSSRSCPTRSSCG